MITITIRSEYVSAFDKTHCCCCCCCCCCIVVGVVVVVVVPVAVVVSGTAAWPCSDHSLSSNQSNHMNKKRNGEMKYMKERDI